MRFASRAEVASKVEWEGGVAEALDYGLKSEDMPEGDHELEGAWNRMEEAYARFDALREKVWDLLSEPGADLEEV